MKIENCYDAFLRDGQDLRASPFQAVVAQTLLGAPHWVQAMRQRLEDGRVGAPDDDTADCEVPAIRQLRRRPTLDDVIQAVVREMRVDRATIGRRHSRNVA